MQSEWSERTGMKHKRRGWNKDAATMFDMVGDCVR